MADLFRFVCQKCGYSMVTDTKDRTFKCIKCQSVMVHKPESSINQSRTKK